MIKNDDAPPQTKLEYTSVQSKHDLDTPCLVLDLDFLEENLRKMQDTVSRADKNLRPHTKTHKCSILARKQLQTGAIGVCASKVSEAEGLIKAGIEEILITGPVATPTKIKRLVKLLEITPSLLIVVDHRDSIEMLASALHANNLTLDVLLDVDAGLNRTGAKPFEAFELADFILSQPTMRLRGIQAYAGQVQHIPLYETRKRESHQCLQKPADIFRELSAVVKTCTIFSTSGTGTFDIDLNVPEVTELQVGSYVCMDAKYLTIGSAENLTQFRFFNPALRLLTSVVSSNHQGFVTVDAGLKSFYKDGGTPQIVGHEFSGLKYDWFGDEYGKVTCPENVEKPPIGTVLEFVTSHCDPTINLFDRYYLTRGNQVVGVWPIDLRGCSQ